MGKKGKTKFGLLWILSLFLLQSFQAFSQEFFLGTPSVENYSKKKFKAGAENSDAIFALGHVFFANNNGLLSYDGNTWQVHGTRNGTIMRSMAIGNQDKIITGSQNEIGYFHIGTDGQLSYVSLRDSLGLPDENLADIWDVGFLQDRIAFSANNSIIIYQNGTELKRYDYPERVTSMSVIEDEIWLQSGSKGIYRIKEGQSELISNSKEFESINAIDFLAGDRGEIYILTESNGIYKFADNQISRWKTLVDGYLKEKRISSGRFHPRFGLALGSYLGGVLLIDDEGKCILQLDKESGLQNSSISSLAFTSTGNLWVATNNGIDEINLSSYQKKIHPDNELEGSVYDVKQWQGKLFFSTSNGLYYIKEKEYYPPLLQEKYQLVANTDGQNWGMDIIDGHLYCAHHTGPKLIKIINGDKIKAEAIQGNSGAWKFIELNSEKVAVGHYDGVKIYTKGEHGQLSFDYEIEGLTESSRVLLFDQHENLWVSHPYNFVYKINFSDNFNKASIKKYAASDGFKTNDKNYVFDIKGTCYLTNETGIYKYNEVSDQFEVSEDLNPLFNSDNHVRSLQQHGDDIWCITDHGTMWLTTKKNGLSIEIKRRDITDIDTDDNYIGGFEKLYPLNKNIILLCSDAGVTEYHLNSNSPRSIEAKILNINLLKQDSLLYQGFGAIPDFELTPKENALHIEFGNNHLRSDPNIQYSYFMENMYDAWSVWSPVSSREFINMDNKDYVFHLRVKTQAGEVSDPIQFKFEVGTPWFKTWTAIVVYSLFLLAMVLALILIPQKKYQENTAILESEKRKTEEEIEVIKREKLQSEIDFKNKELAMSTMHLLHKNETLTAIRNEIENVATKIKDEQAKKEVKKIIGLLKSDDRLEDDWNNFSIHFDQVHHDFLKRIKKEFPELTPKDQKLCAYLRMNLTTKEIAPLLKISVRGVEISRYRLRKKIGLDGEQNLNEFMMGY